MKDIIEHLEKFYTNKQREMYGIGVVQFNNRDVTVHDSDKSMTLRMSIEDVERRDVSFASDAQWANFTTTSSNFLVIRAKGSSIKPGQGGYHALYVESYDPGRGSFNCINSWGPTEAPKPRLADTDDGISHAYRINLTRTDESPRAAQPVLPPTPAAPAGK